MVRLPNNQITRQPNNQIMVEKREIELIPREIEAAKGLASLLTRLRLIGLGTLGVAAVLSAAAWGATAAQAVRLNAVEDSITSQIEELAKHADTEKLAFGLAVKSQAITSIFTQRNYFSLLLNAVSSSTPTGINVKGLSATKDAIVVTISGDTTSYEELSKFLKNLIDTSRGGTVFVEASLTSVVQDSATGRASFVIELTTRNNGLRKPLEEVK